MKKALTKNLGLKILALAFSALLWWLVMNTENPIMSQTFTGIPVEVTHGEIITNKGNTYQVREGSQTISVVVQAKRKTLNKMRSEDIKAVADMKNLDNISSMVRVDVTVPRYKIEGAVATPRNIQVVIDSNKTWTFPITPTTSGTVQDGYVVGKVTSNPEKVEISGPKTVVESIDKVVAEVDVSGLSRDSELPAEIILYNADNRIIDPTQLKMNIGEKGVVVNVTLLRTKAVTLNFDTSMIWADDGYWLSGVTVEPQTVRITGDAEKLAEIESIDIPASVLQESGLTEGVEKNIPITDIEEYLPEWAELAEDNPGNIVVNVGIELLGTQSYDVALASIYLKNVAPGLKAEFNTTGIVSIKVKGPKEILDDLQLDQSNVSLNMLTYTTPGEHNVPLEVSLPDECSLVDSGLSVKIILEKQ